MPVHANATGTELHEDKRVKEPVRAASTANITLTAPGATIDGVAMAVGNRFLAKDQTTTSQNGPYVWNGAAVAATRTADADSAADFVYNFLIGVREGTVNGGKIWSYTQSAAVTLGSTAITFAQIGATSGSVTANTVYAGATSGGAAVPAFRALVAADIPAIAESGVTNLTTDLAAKANLASPTFTGTLTTPAVALTGLTGSTAASRLVGATATGAPASGAHVVGDVAVDQTGKMWVCTSSGTPGTFGQVGAGGTATLTVQEVDGAPSVSASVLRFPNSTLTDNGSGTVTYTPTGGTAAAATIFLARNCI